MGKLLDARLDEVYRSHGKPGVDWRLCYEDGAEVIVSRIGAQFVFLRSGDRRAYDAPIIAKPPS